MFVARDDSYLDFAPGVTQTGLKAVVTSEEGVLTREAEIRAALDRWWEQHVGLLASLPSAGSLMNVRRSPGELHG